MNMCACSMRFRWSLVIFITAVFATSAFACTDEVATDPEVSIEGVGGGDDEESKQLRIDEVTPAEGSAEGGTLVTLIGRGFSANTQVLFGDHKAPHVRVLSNKVLQVRTPPGKPGSVDVVAKKRRARARRKRGFKYVAKFACRIHKVTPSFGETDVAIRPALRVEWGKPINLENIEDRLRVTRLPGSHPEETPGDEVPFRVVSTDRNAVELELTRSLRFFNVYALSIDSVRSAKGERCEPGAVAFATVVPHAVEQPQRVSVSETMAVVGDTLLSVARDARSLQVLDATDPETPVLEDELRVSITPLHMSVSPDETRAYVAGGFQGVLIVDIAMPRQPRVLGVAGTPGFARQTVAFERDGRQLLAVADGRWGVRLLDVSDPEGVQNLATVLFGREPGLGGNDVRALARSGDRLGVANGAFGTAVISLSDLRRPTVVAEREAPGAPVDQVAIWNDLLFTNRGVVFVDALDLSDATLPTLGSLRACDECFQQFPLRFTVQSPAPGSAELHIVGAREGFRAFSLDGALDPGGAFSFGGSRIPDAAVSRPYVEAPSTFLATAGAIYASTRSGLFSFDRIGDDPSRRATLQGHGLVTSVGSQGGTLYAAALNAGVEVFQLEDVEQPAFLRRVATPASPLGDLSSFTVTPREREGNTLVVGDARGGVVVFDASDPLLPVLSGQQMALDAVRRVSLGEELIYACEDNVGLIISELNPAGVPNLVARVRFEDIRPGSRDQCSDVLADEARGVLFVASRLGLAVLDVSDPAAPRVLTAVDLPARDLLGSLALRGDALFAGTTAADFEGRFERNHRVQIFDVSDPAMPERVWVSEELGSVQDVVVRADVLFVSSADLGVRFYDVADSFAPVLEGRASTFGNATELDAGDNALYIAQRSGGVGVMHTGPLP